MAWTTTKNFEYAAGHHKVQLWELAADSATLELSTGFNSVDHIAFAAASFTSSHPNIKRNVLSAGTASNGTVSVTGCTSGDTMFLTVWGH
jgi:hypothetical protein